MGILAIILSMGGSSEGAITEEVLAADSDSITIEDADNIEIIFY